jgi:replicative DNA helicase
MMQQKTIQLAQKEYELLGIMMKNRELIPVISKQLEGIEFIQPDSLNVLKTLIRRQATDSEINILDVAMDSKAPIDEVFKIQDSVFEDEEKQWKAYLRTYLSLYDEIKIATISINGLSPEDAMKKIKKDCIHKFEESEIKDSQVAAYDSLSTMEDLKTARIKIEFPRLDDTLRFCKTQLAVISARPKVGKTTLALNLANQISKAGKKIIIFSFEMSAFEIVQKLVRLNYPKLKDDEQTPAYNKAVSKFLTEPHGDKIILIESAGMSPGEIKEKIIEYKPEVVMVDQLDCLPVIALKGDRHDLRVGENVNALKRIAIETKTLILLLHQLNRGSDQKDQPELYNLKDTSIVEQKADIVMMLWEKDNEYFLKVGANRMGDTGTIPFKFAKKRSLFIEEALKT